ncbi:MAG: MFS transporter [Deltaproteobacteria bacterium]|nr:MFS transporter [Deltaproteobacteria bacterium]
MTGAASAWKRVAFLLFCVAWGANHFAALLLVYRGTLHLDASGPALIFAMYALGLVPGLLLAGPVSDRLGRRALVLPAALGAFVASIILASGGESFATLLLGRFLYGMAAGSAMGPGAVWVLELSSGEASSGAGARRATIALTAGFAFGPLSSGVLAQWAPHPTVLPYVVLLATLAIAIALALGVPTPPARTGSPRPWLSLGLNAQNRRPFLLGVALMAPFVFAFPTISFATIPNMLGGGLGSAPVAFIGLLAAVTMTAGVLAQPLTRGLMPLRSARLGLGAGVLALLLGILAVHWGARWMLFVTAPLLGVGYGTCMTAGLRSVEALSVPETRGGLTGVYYVLTYIGFAAPYALAVAQRAWAPEAVLGGVAVLAAGAAVGLRRVAGNA